MTSQERDGLVEALKQRFAAQVDFELVGDNGRYRFAVVSPQFDGMPHLARQDAIWLVVDEVLSREASIDVSLILAYSPADLAATS